MNPPAELLVAWIVRQTSPEAVAWFNAKRSDLTTNSPPRAFASVFGSVVRRMGKDKLDLELFRFGDGRENPTPMAAGRTNGRPGSPNCFAR